jgi:hypothetical protein
MLGQAVGKHSRRVRIGSDVRVGVKSGSRKVSKCFLICSRKRTSDLRANEYSLFAVGRIGPRQRRMGAAEIRRAGILAELDDAAADRARACEEIEKGVAIRPADRARERRQILVEPSM